MVMNRTVWRDAYADILTPDVLNDLDIPEGEALRERYVDARRTGQQFLVTVDSDSGDSTSGDPAVIGFAQFVLDSDLSKPFVGDDEAGLRALYVAPDRQGEGIGTRLLDAGLDRLPADTDAVVLETFRDNDAARGFYESRGFSLRDEATFDIADESYPTVVYAKSV